MFLIKRQDGASVAKRGTLYFTTMYGSKDGMQDLYISFRYEDGKWGEPQNLGEKINTRYSESFPFVSRDGKYLFFNSNRPSSLHNESTEHFYGNIYWVDAQFLEELKPKGMN